MPVGAMRNSCLPSAIFAQLALTWTELRWDLRNLRKPNLNSGETCATCANLNWRSVTLAQLAQTWTELRWDLRSLRKPNPTSGETCATCANLNRPSVTLSQLAQTWYGLRYYYTGEIQQIIFNLTNLICENLCCLRNLCALDSEYLVSWKLFGLSK